MGLQTKTFSYGSLTDKSVLNGYLLELTLTERSVDMVKNTSQVDFTLKLRSGSKNRFNLYGLGAFVTLDGKVAGSRDRYNEPQVSLGYNDAVTLVSGSTTIAHGADGKKTLGVAFSMDMSTGSYVPGPVSVTGKTWALTTIPRASTLTATDANIGGVSTIVVDRKSTAFTHTIGVKFGSLTGYLNGSGALVSGAEKLSKTTLAFAVPTSFYAQIPNSASGQCTLTCTTWDSTGQVGQQETTFTVTAAKSLCAPEIQASVQDVNEATIALTGDENTLIRYESTARCRVVATAKNSAAITGVTVNGKKVTDGVWEVAKAEEAVYVAACKDSRGYESSVTWQPGFVPYVKLTCNLQAKRLQPTNGTAQVTVSGNCFAGSFGAADNALTLTYTVGGNQYTAEAVFSGNTYRAVLNLTDLDYTQSHGIIVQAQDKLQTVTKSVTVQPGIPVFDWGKADFAFHVPVSFQGSPMTDFVVEQGDVNGWYYRKWQSGLGECFYRKQLTADVTTAMGSLFTSGALAESDADFPFPFKALPSLTAGLTGQGYAGMLSPAGSSILTINKTGAYQILRPTASTAGTYRICYHAIGMWK